MRGSPKHYNSLLDIENCFAAGGPTRTDMQRWLGPHWLADDGAYNRFGFASREIAINFVDDDPYKVRVVFEGDSRSDGTAYPATAALLAGIGAYPYFSGIWEEVAEYGDTTSNIVADRATQIIYDNDYEINIAVCWAGVNDRFHGDGKYDPGPYIIGNIQDWCEDCQSVGFKTLIVTECPILNNADWNTYVRADLNAEWLTPRPYIDAIADSGNDPRMVPTDTIVYYDGLHLQPWGYVNVIAPYVAAAILELVGIDSTFLDISTHNRSW